MRLLCLVTLWLFKALEEDQALKKPNEVFRCNFHVSSKVQVRKQKNLPTDAKLIFQKFSYVIILTGVPLQPHPVTQGLPQTWPF